MKSDLETAMAELCLTYSKRQVEAALSRVTEEELSGELTFVVNAGMHALPVDILKGETFYFSEGNVDLSQENVKETVKELSKKAVKFLRSRVWTKIYIIPSGHPLLVTLATLVVYRVTRVNPIILYYVDGAYREVAIDVRHDVFGSS
ncbi:hypothetical protein [Sphingomonas faeni]|uniref:hypothetical protein n=1 Tax=Sphingomonas faeni TaxID=185950 RepID=UPI0011B21141|nr:hypothetical protein [Sphingomonas faeni]